MVAVVAGALSLGMWARAADASADVSAVCAPAQSCGQVGTGGGAVARHVGTPTPDPCVQRAACGGGAALAAGAVALVAVLVRTPTSPLQHSLRWTIRPAVQRFLDPLLAGRLFRPPRLSF